MQSSLATVAGTSRSVLKSLIPALKYRPFNNIGSSRQHFTNPSIHRHFSSLLLPDRRHLSAHFPKLLVRKLCPFGQPVHAALRRRESRSCLTSEAPSHSRQPSSQFESPASPRPPHAYGLRRFSAAFAIAPSRPPRPSSPLDPVPPHPRVLQPLLAKRQTQFGVRRCRAVFEVAPNLKPPRAAASAPCRPIPYTGAALLRPMSARFRRLESAPFPATSSLTVSALLIRMSTTP